jgi:hypothetical protein
MNNDTTSKETLPGAHQVVGDAWVLAVLEDLRNYAEHRDLPEFVGVFQTAITGISEHLCAKTERNYLIRRGDA